MYFDIKQQNDEIYATLSGRLDTPAAVTAQQEITPILQNADKTIIIDCTNLQYISSSGLRILLTIRKQTDAKGGRVIIQHPNDNIQKVFLMTGFNKLFDIR